MKSMKDYHNLCLKCEVVLLAELCPSHFLIAPALSWDPMLNMTKIKLELISDLCMYIFFEKGTRSEVSYISNK